MDKRTPTERAWDAGFREGVRRTSEPHCKLAQDLADRAFEMRMSEHRAQLLLEAIGSRRYKNNILDVAAKKRAELQDPRDVELIDMLFQINDDMRAERQAQNHRNEYNRRVDRLKNDEEYRAQVREYQRQWRESNREKARGYSKKFWDNNKDRVNAERRAKRDGNADAAATDRLDTACPAKVSGTSAHLPLRE